ncbi:MAG: acyl-CoA dehydrogenase family protein [Syntrophales bacterium]
MDFELSKEHKMLRKAVRLFAEKKVAPRALEIDEKGEFPFDITEEMGRMGLIGLVNSGSYGGNGMGHLARMIVIEELSRIFPSLGFFFQAGNLLMFAIESFGNEDQKKKLLPGFCSGKTIGAFAVTEASGGSDPTTMMTTAVRDGHGYTVNGRKTFITNPEVADYLGFLCRTEDKFSVFYVEKGTKGYEVTRREPRPGFRCIPVNELVFADCWLPKDNLIGQEGKGLNAAFTTISTIGRTGAAGVALGAMQGAYDGALKFCKERIMYGQPVANLQAIQFALADMNTEIEATRWLCYLAAWMLDRGKSPREIAPEISRAKLYSVDMALKNCIRAQQLMGAYGQSPEYRVEIFLRDMLELLTAGGTQEIMRVTIGRSITS